MMAMSGEDQVPFALRDLELHILEGNCVPQYFTRKAEEPKGAKEDQDQAG